MDQASGGRQDFSSAISRHGCVNVVSLTGELDIATAQALHRALAEAVTGVREPHLVIDLEGVEFCDSTGLSVLLTAMNGAQSAGGRVVLSGVRARMARLLTMTGLSKRFEIRGTTAEAVRELLGQ